MVASPLRWTNIPATRSAGSASALLYVHGFGCSRIVWNAVTDHLRDAYRHVLVDLPGHGLEASNSYCRERHATLSGMARAVEDMLAAASLDQPAVLVGHSIGCNLAWRVALARPDRVAKLVLINPSPCFMNLEGYSGGFGASDLERLLDLMVHNPLAWSASLADLVAGGKNPTSAWLAQSFCSVEPECLHAFARATFFVDDRAMLPRVQQPCLVLSSARDSLVPPAVHDFMVAALPRAVGEILDIAGHAAHLTHPALVAESLRRFVA